MSLCVVQILQEVQEVPLIRALHQIPKHGEVCSTEQRYCTFDHEAHRVPRWSGCSLWSKGSLYKETFWVITAHSMGWFVLLAFCPGLPGAPGKPRCPCGPLAPGWPGSPGKPSRPLFPFGPFRPRAPFGPFAPLGPGGPG